MASGNFHLNICERVGGKSRNIRLWKQFYLFISSGRILGTLRGPQTTVWELSFRVWVIGGLERAGSIAVCRVPSTWKEASRGEEAFPHHLLHSATVQTPNFNHWCMTAMGGKNVVFHPWVETGIDDIRSVYLWVSVQGLWVSVFIL